MQPDQPLSVPAGPGVLSFEVRFDRRFRRAMYRDATRVPRRLCWVLGGVLLVTGFAGLQVDSAWALVGLFGAVIGLGAWLFALGTLFPADRRMPPAWFRPVGYGLTAQGIGWAGTGAIICYLPWTRVRELREQRDRFVLVGRDGTAVRLIPRTGMDPATADRIRTAIAEALAGSATMAG